MIEAAAEADEVAPSPNHDRRAGSGRPDMLLLHYTGMRSGAEALARLRDPDAKVSSHFLVEEDGRIFQLVAENRRAWHAGQGSWKGLADINSRSVGIEIVNPGHEHGYRPFPSDQIAAVIRLCRGAIARWRIEAQLVLAHSDIAPRRKEDPGELFPWNRLHEAGIGHLVPPTPLSPGGSSLRDGDSGSAVQAFQGSLADYGYECDNDGIFGEATRLATAAFQRHFRPDRVDGVADASTRDTLRRLLAAL